MLVYARRESTTASSDPPSRVVQPPEQIRNIIEEINIKHDMACDIWTQQFVPACHILSGLFPGYRMQNANNKTNRY